MQRKKTFLVVCISILTVTARAQYQPAPPVEKNNLPPFHFIRVDSSYYTQHLGFFCKKAIEVQKWVHLPIFFRLGSLDYVNKLEGKPGANPLLETTPR